MKRARLFIVAAWLIGLLSPAQGQIFFVAKMDSAQEVPSPTGNVPGTGTGSFVLNAAATQLYYNITVNGLSGSISAGHFHNGPAGVAAGVVKALSFVNNSASGIWTSTDASQPLTDSLISELLKGRLYINVHTSANPGGEIRGQVLLTSGVGFTAKMDSAQETPSPVGTVPGRGTFSVTYWPTGQVTYDGTVTGLSGTLNAGHFHNAAVGVAGGVVKPLSFTNNTSTGTWTSSDPSQPLTDGLLRSLIKGQLYINVHTTANPGGEIRGQVFVNNGVTATVKMDSAQETPSPVGLVPGTGTGTVVLNAAGNSISYAITVNGLSGPITGGHFHNGAGGVAAGVVKSLTFVNNAAIGTWSSTDATQPRTDSLISEFLRGRLYVNVHTSANPGGEIRGQVLLTTGDGFTANMDSAQETPAPIGAVPGKGTVAVMLQTNGDVTYDGTVTGLSGTLNAGHFHNGAPGVAGGVVKALSFTKNTTTGIWAGSDGTQPLTDVLLRALIKGQLYVNVHTAATPGGEIRGQVGNGGSFVTAVNEQVSNGLPASFELSQNYPNPFNPSTTISFALTKAGRVSLRIYNMLGQQVATLIDGVRGVGTYKVTFDARTLSSGIYLYRLSTSGTTAVRKMLLLK